MSQSPGALFERLLEIMARLRDSGGCPWDREQTRTSLKAYLLEEAYEVLEAIEANEPSAIEEELGDLLFQVVFHAQLARELGEFTMADVLQRLCDKMVSRHPHVFGDASVGTAGEALVQWEMIKQREAEESGRRRSVTDMEADLIAQGTSIGKAGQDDMERSWQAAKAHERTRSGDRA